MKIITATNEKELTRIFQELKVDPYGIKIMLPKAMHYLVMIKGVSCIEANILKQEMLSLGADAAVSREVLTGGRKKTDCLLIGNLSQITHLIDKLRIQPFGLQEISKQLSALLTHHHTKGFSVAVREKTIRLCAGIHLMGILNLTPDSFSADGMSGQSLKCILDRIERLVEEGADSVDIGGESSRPGAPAVALKEELRRTIPVFKAASKRIKVPLSVDTTKPEVAKQALDNGASMVNDITGLRNEEMAKVVARYKAGVILMHMKGTPPTMQRQPRYRGVMDDIIAFLSHAIKRARQSGIDSRSIIIDPGIGFGKTLEHNLEILNKLSELKSLDMPIMVGPSRKSFIGRIIDKEPTERLSGTLAACVMAALNGAHMLRVHDVTQVKQALKVAGAIAALW